MSFQKILVAIDRSGLCKFVFAQALELAKTNQAALMLFHSVDEGLSQPTLSVPTELGLYSEAVNAVYEVRQQQVEKQIEQVQALLRNYCETATSQGILTEFDYKVGEAGQWLCKMAQNWNADLIILGRRGRKGLTEALLGSVSNYVLHHAPCSVLVIQSVGTQESHASATVEFGKTQ